MHQKLFCSFLRLKSVAVMVEQEYSSSGSSNSLFYYVISQMGRNRVKLQRDLSKVTDSWQELQRDTLSRRKYRDLPRVAETSNVV